MRSLFATCFGFVYRHIIKYGIFLMSPDTAHHETLRFAEWFSRFQPLRWLTRVCFKPAPRPMLQQSLLGLTFDSPVGLSAGFDKNAEAVGVTSQLGYAFGTVGSVTAHVCEGNPKPWFYRLKKSQSMVVYVGLANQGVRQVLARVDRFRRRIHRRHHLVLSIAKTNSKTVVSEAQGIEDYKLSYAAAANHARIRMVEINISCPNTYGGEPFTKPTALNNLLKELATVVIDKPVTIKLPSDLDWSATKKLVDVAARYPFVQALTVANLAKDRSRVSLSDELPDEIKGNLSGAPVRELSNNLLRNLRKQYDDRFVLIGVGGILSVDDAYEKIRAGADLIELITGMIYTGPQLPTQIIYGLERRLRRDGFAHISEAVGADV